MEESPYEEKVRKWVDDPYIFDPNYGKRSVNIEEGILLTDVWESALGGSANRLDWRIMRNVGAALRSCGMEKRRVMVDGKQNFRWFMKVK